MGVNFSKSSDIESVFARSLDFMYFFMTKKIAATRKNCVAAFAYHLKLFFFVVEQAVAVPFKIRIGNLLLELLAHTFEILTSGEPAGTVSSRALKPLPDSFDYFFIFIEFNFHSNITYDSE